MKTFSFRDAPIEVHGLPFWNQTHTLERIPPEDLKAFPLLSHFGRRCPGARICFRTNSTKLTIRLSLETLSFDIGMSIFACQSIDVLIGPRSNPRFAGLVSPPNYETRSAEKTFLKSSDWEDITLFLPRNERITDLQILLDDNADIQPPTPYAHGPVLYYGSSITEGGCCCRVSNPYNALLSQWLDCDYYNFGFSGSALGEPEMADLICRTPMNVFVFDYDHNAPTPEHLQQTHEPFFLRIRKHFPSLPIILLSRPTFSPSQDANMRAHIIQQTYLNARANGDSRIWFIDGRSYFGSEASLCSSDDCHPNDLGFYRMAKTLEPILKQALACAEQPQ